MLTIYPPDFKVDNALDLTCTVVYVPLGSILLLGQVCLDSELPLAQ